MLRTHLRLWSTTKSYYSVVISVDDDVVCTLSEVETVLFKVLFGIDKLYFFNFMTCNVTFHQLVFPAFSDETQN